VFIFLNFLKVNHRKLIADLFLLLRLVGSYQLKCCEACHDHLINQIQQIFAKEALLPIKIKDIVSFIQKAFLQKINEVRVGRRIGILAKVRLKTLC